MSHIWGYDNSKAASMQVVGTDNAGIGVNQFLGYADQEKVSKDFLFSVMVSSPRMP